MKLSSVLCGNLDEKGVWGRMDACIYMAEFLFYSSEFITTLLIVYTPMQKEKLKEKKYYIKLRPSAHLNL